MKSVQIFIGLDHSVGTAGKDQQTVGLTRLLTPFGLWKEAYLALKRLKVQSFKNVGYLFIGIIYIVHEWR